jgi:hypothetical protein
MSQGFAFTRVAPSWFRKTTSHQRIDNIYWAYHTASNAMNRASTDMKSHIYNSNPLSPNNSDCKLYFNSNHQLVLSYEDNSIASSQNKYLEYSVDFNEKSLCKRIKKISSELIIRAIGANTSNQNNTNKRLLVWDLTAGLGRDSFLIHSANVDVVMFERNILLYSLLKDGVKRYKETQSQISNDLHNKNSSIFDVFNLDLTKDIKDINEISSISTIPPDVIYLDPMYNELEPSTNTAPKVRKSLCKKYTQIIQHIVASYNSQVPLPQHATDASIGLESHLRADSTNCSNSIDDERSNSVRLFERALEIGPSRIVVKRELTAVPIAKAIPHSSIRGRTQRFDIYVKSNKLRYM